MTFSPLYRSSPLGFDSRVRRRRKPRSAKAGDVIPRHAAVMSGSYVSGAMSPCMAPCAAAFSEGVFAARLYAMPMPSAFALF